MPRFVILRHETPPDYPRPSHWDLMLECAGALRTWALPEEPTVGSKQTAEPLNDHRIEYLDYEGPVSAGRGTVSQWDEGNYELVEDSPQRLHVKLFGRSIRAELTIVPSTDDQQSVRLTIAALSWLGC